MDIHRERSRNGSPVQAPRAAFARGSRASVPFTGSRCSLWWEFLDSGREGSLQPGLRQRKSGS
jgi:hypothetical protein